jgi:hypothetical protein
MATLSHTVTVQSDGCYHYIAAVKDYQAFVDVVKAMILSMNESSPAAAAAVIARLPETQAE